MRRILFFLVLVFVSGIVECRELEDVIYLKNGSIIRGIMLEQIPGQTFKLQTRDGNIFVYNASEVMKITREAPVESSTPDKPPQSKVVRVSGPTTVTKRGNPGTALLLGFLPGVVGIQGCGQFYNGDVGKGALFLGAGLVSLGGFYNENEKAGWPDDPVGSGYAVVFVTSWVFSCIDAYKSAGNLNSTSARLTFQPGPVVAGGSTGYGMGVRYSF